MLIKFYQKGTNGKPILGYKPQPGQKQFTQEELEQNVPILVRNTKTKQEIEENRKRQEGSQQERITTGQKMFYNNFINGALELNPKKMLYAQPTGPQITRELQQARNETSLQNFQRTTQPTITNMMLAETVGQGMQKMQPYVQEGLRKLPAFIEYKMPASIDKMIKPKIDIRFNPRGNHYRGGFLKDKDYLDDGLEYFVYNDYKGNVFKLRAPTSPTKDIKGIKLANKTIQDLGGPKTEIYGYFKHPFSKKLQPIIKQDYINGRSQTNAEVANFIYDKKLTYPEGYRYKNTLLSDLHNDNIIVDINGIPRVIDLYAEKWGSRPLRNIDQNEAEGLVKSIINTNYDFEVQQRMAKQNVRDYLNHPTVTRTAEKNLQLSDRLGLRPPSDPKSLPDPSYKHLFKPISLTEYRNMNLNRPFNITVGELSEHTGAEISGNNIVLNWKKHYVSPRERIVDDLEHEFLHGAGYGNKSIERLKQEKLLKPKKELRELQKNDEMVRIDYDEYPEHYLTTLGETQTNVRDLAKELNVKIGQTYPGQQQLQNLLQQSKRKNFVVDALRLNTPRDYKRVWDALTGKYFTVPQLGLTYYQTKKQ